MAPLTGDDSGNLLLAMDFPDESEVDGMDCSLVVVRLENEVLLVFDRWRKQWELPGGGVEPGETAREAAVRELAEETGIAGAPLEFRAVADFALANPARRQRGAIYATTLHAPPTLVVNDEVSAFRWWRTDSPLVPDLNPIDATLAVRIG
ncbi:NUDIX hydrolase [Actinophytocola sediminis]